MTEPSIWRVLDVNANRAAEGLRTLEDVARLIREDVVAAQWIKTLRHEFAAIVSKLDRCQRLAARCTESDAGRESIAEREHERENWQAIVTAGCERVGQSLRSLEEFSKLVDANVADESIGQAFKALRYRAYDTLAEFEMRLLRDQGLRAARIYLLMECSQPVADFVALVRTYAAAGVDLFQLRDKTCEGGRLVQYARAAVSALRDSTAKLIINDRIDIALASGAAGVHLGQQDLLLQDARRIAGSQLWIGVSTHDLQQAMTAERGGADYLGCGPTFPSRTKSFSNFPGVRFLSEIAGTISIPAFAIGGIDANNLDEVLAAGGRRVALSSAVHRSDQPARMLRELRQRLEAAK